MSEASLPPDTRILLAILQGDGEYVSGTGIAESVNLSRVAVWNRLEQLREEGFDFEAVRNRGYRLNGQPDQLHPRLLEAMLAEDGLYLPIEYHDRIDSTNSEAERLLSHKRDVPFLVLAGEQTQGRGRRGRVWHSPRGVRFYGSFGFRPSIPPMGLQTITLWWGLSLCRYFRQRYDLPVKVKWPNDLYIGERKIAGLLTEARVDGERTRDLILGLGVNLHGKEEDFPHELRMSAGTLSMANGGNDFPVHPLTAGMVRTVIDAYEAFVADRYKDILESLWPEYDFLRNREVITDQGPGTVIGITRQGSLKLRRPDGSLLNLHSGEANVKFD